MQAYSLGNKGIHAMFRYQLYIQLSPLVSTGPNTVSKISKAFDDSKVLEDAAHSSEYQKYKRHPTICSSRPEEEYQDDIGQRV